MRAHYGWMTIPGVPDFFETLSVNGLEDLTTSITKNLDINNKASSTLFKNWCDLVFDYIILLFYALTILLLHRNTINVKI